MALHLADRGCEVARVDADEIHVARADERMQAGIERGIGRRDHVDLEQRARLAAEDDRECDDEREREQEIEDERRAVAQELEVSRMPDGQQAAEVHVRNSRPVSSRKRSSRLRGRIRSRLSGMPRPSNACSAPSTSPVEISMRSLATRTGRGKSAGLAAEVLARQLQDDVVEVLLEQARRRPLRDDEPAIHDRDDVAEVVRLFHVVRRQQDRPALGLDGPEQLPEVVAGLRIEAGRRLVEEQDARVVGEGDREQQALHLPAGELAVVAVGDLLERAGHDQLVDVAPPRVQAREQRERLAHRQEVLEGRLLELDPGLRAKLRAERLAAIQHLAGRRLRDALHHLHGRGLAGAIRAEQSEALSFRDGERNAIDRAHAGILLDEFAYFEHGRHGDWHAISLRA